MLTNYDWFMRHGHESRTTAAGFSVRVWAWGAKRPPVSGEGRTWDAAVAAARDEARRLSPPFVVSGV